MSAVEVSGHETRSIAPIVGTVVGVPMLAFGIWGTLSDRSATHPFELARWVIASDLVHDLIAAPLIVITAWLVGRFAPAMFRNPLRWGFGATGVLLLYAWPFLRGYGRNPSVPSLLNRNYATGLSVYRVIVWVIAIGWAAGNTLRHRRDSLPQE